MNLQDKLNVYMAVVNGKKELKEFLDLFNGDWYDAVVWCQILYKKHGVLLPCGDKLPHKIPKAG
jgi:hypothetical protein